MSNVQQILYTHPLDSVLSVLLDIFYHVIIPLSPRIYPSHLLMHFQVINISTLSPKHVNMHIINYSYVFAYGFIIYQLFISIYLSIPIYHLVLFIVSVCNSNPY